jgi:SAM-dependent methyltransferase
MPLNVLKSLADVDASRRELRRMRASCISSSSIRFLRRIGLFNGIELGDHIKSWDVLQTTRFIQDHLPFDAPILDIGAYASEILCILHRLGYRNLTGVDLNPEINRMPNADIIRYEVSDFMATPFSDGSFAAITATSVIEHGFQCNRLLQEISRLLRPGGHFLASVDYWPEKLDTSGIRFFGMDWTIFSRDEIIALIKQAGRYRFNCPEPIDTDTTQPVIKGGGKEYTFAWLALTKT